MEFLLVNQHVLPRDLFRLALQSLNGVHRNFCPRQLLGAIYYNINFKTKFLWNDNILHIRNSYNVHLRKMDTEETFTVIEKDNAPIIIEDLEANAFYEAYVVAGKKKHVFRQYFINISYSNLLQLMFMDAVRQVPA